MSYDAKQLGLLASMIDISDCRWQETPNGFREMVAGRPCPGWASGNSIGIMEWEADWQAAVRVTRAKAIMDRVEEVLKEEEQTKKTE